MNPLNTMKLDHKTEKEAVDNILVRILGFMLIIASVYSLGGFYVISPEYSTFYQVFCWAVLFFWNFHLFYFSVEYPISVLRKKGYLIYGISCVTISVVIWVLTIILIIYGTVITPFYHDYIFLIVSGTLISIVFTFACLYRIWRS
jgi:hypothetical protein